MALRLSFISWVLAMLTMSGCTPSSCHKPACCSPGVVATAPRRVLGRAVPNRCPCSAARGFRDTVKPHHERSDWWGSRTA